MVYSLGFRVRASRTRDWSIAQIKLDPSPAPSTFQGSPPQKLSSAGIHLRTTGKELRGSLVMFAGLLTSACHEGVHEHRGISRDVQKP